jgi:hypothetical protein
MVHRLLDQSALRSRTDRQTCARGVARRVRIGSSYGRRLPVEDWHGTKVCSTERSQTRLSEQRVLPGDVLAHEPKELRVVAAGDEFFAAPAHGPESRQRVLFAADQKPHALRVQPVCEARP